jgi:CHAT domain-containing protein/tetratricopeptide (TPR) repeat protein
MSPTAGLAISCFLFGLSWLSAISPGTPAQTPVAIPLVNGQLIARAPKPGERHQYTLAWPPGQYLHLVVRQSGVRLTASVSDAKGERVASGDRANQMHGPKSIHLVTATGDAYTLEIQTTDVAQAGGRYTVELVSTRSAGERERQLFAAQTLFSAAFSLASQPIPVTRGQAREKYLAALDAFRAAGDLEGEALTLTELGLVTYFLNERRQSIEWYKQALPVWRASHDQYGEARALNNLGVAHADLGELQEARAYYRQVLPLWRAVGDLNGQSRTLNNISATHFYLGEWQDALTCSQQALELWRQAGDLSSEPFALNSLGILYFELGDPVQALALQQQALARAQSVTPPTVQSLGIEAKILTNLGELSIAQHDEAQALSYLNKAEKLHRLNESKDLAMTLADLGFVHNRAGRQAEALAHYAEALALARSNKYRFLEATVLKKLGELLGQPEPDRARTHFRDALALFRALEEKDAEAEVLYDLALLERAQGNTAAARQQLEATLTLAEGLRTKVGSLDLRALFFARKQDYFTAYIDLLMQEHHAQPNAGLAGLALQTGERARARSLLELLAEARAEVQRGAPPELLARLQTLRALIVGKTNRLLRLRNEKETTPEQLAASAAEVRQHTAEYEQVQAQLRSQPRYATLTQPEPLQLAKMQALLNPQTLLLQYALGPTRSYLWVVSHNDLTSYELKGRAEIETAAQAVLALMTAHQPVPGEAFSQRAARFRAVENSYGPGAARLSQLVLGPLAGKLKKKRLLIVPDGALQNISFSALPEPPANPARGMAQPLLVNHEVVYLPSASVLAVQRQERRKQPVAPRAAAVFADPVFAADDPRVGQRSQTPVQQIAPAAKLDLAAQATRAAPGVSWLREEVVLPRLQNSLGELRAIEALLPRGAAFTAQAFAANREAVLTPELKLYRLIHFATHALLNDEHPALSGIVLSLVNPDGTPRAGFLQLHDIYNLDLAADLVVLSACQTARGQTVRGEGVIGLTRGFLHSGAQRVVSSLWAVEDTATSELMRLFYQGLLQQKLRPAAALRQAQLALWRQRAWQSPYYWSGFVLHGEWQ